MTPIFRLHLLLTFAAIVILMVAVLRHTHAAPAEDRMTPMHGIVIECHPGPCVAPSQLLTPWQAWQMKRDLGNDVLIVDIRGRAEAYFTGIPYGIDVQVPFMEPRPDFAWNASAQEPEMDFRSDFVWNLDEALRARHLKHDAPVVLMCRSGERAPVAALLLQEHGYSKVYIVRDGFEGHLARRPDGSGSDFRSEGGWKNSGLPWTSRVYARWALSEQPAQR